MYSNSQSYLGGAGASRPGPQGYGQPSPFNSAPPQQPQQQQQQNAFSPNATGYGGGLQPQFTGYPGQPQPQLQTQPTGFPGQQMQPQMTAFPSQPPMQSQYTGYPGQSQPPAQQPFQTGFQSSSAAANAPPPPTPPKQQPQPTGMTSSQMADSFRSKPAAQPAPAAKSTTSSRIPNIRLSFITAADQANFEQLFKSSVGTNQAMSGDQAREILLRSNLSGDKLSDIWTLSDTTKSGQLLFPEFALAMYLCSMSLSNKPLPPKLPEKIANEVSSIVDIISFGVPDDQPASRQTNAPNFNETKTIQQPQPQQPSNSQLLSQLVTQPTGFQPSYQQTQPTGMLPQQTGFNNAQPTGFNNPQPMGYNGPMPPMPPMPTGFQSQMALPLNAQPTGRPGQWGLANTPASGLPNIEALQQQMMPQPGREGGFSATGLRGNATIPWAVTKDEKKIYDNLFKTWDGFNKGFITGNQAIEIFEQSGLDKSDLEKIWTLSDPNNKGRLDLDEFAVAMHLIYRKLNGYAVPGRLPPELIPPSTRNLKASLGSVKSMLSRDAEERKNTTSYLDPNQTGVSYLKNRSFGAAGAGYQQRKDATVFKNNDDDVGYRSSARRRIGMDGRSPSPSQASTTSEQPDDLPLDMLRKKIREKQVLLDAIDFQDENMVEQDEALDRKDQRDAQELYQRIRRLQEDIDAHPNSSLSSGGSDAERRNMRRQLQVLTDRLPELASEVRRTERLIADAKLELFRLKDAREHPGTSSATIGTGPGGAVTESDRLRARAKAMMQQRSAALAGRPAPAGDDSAAATQRFEAESERVKAERERNDRMVGDVQESVTTYGRSIEDSLKENGEDSTSEHERRRWDDGLGVEDEVRDFIYELQRSSRSARIRHEDTRRDSGSRNVRSPPAEAARPSPTPRTEIPSARVETPRGATASSSAGSSYASYKTAEERAAFIKQQAEQRMAERLAALGLRAPAKAAAPAASAPASNDRDSRLKQAEEEDARREKERQRRLADEQITPPTADKKKAPPAPPLRKNKAESVGRSVDDDLKTEQQALKEQQSAQEAQTRALEDEEKRQEDEFRREQEASEARRKALEEQVRQGKIKREEEKRRKKEAQKETQAKEARLAQQRAELEAARAREAELQRQLEAMGDEDSSSDDEGPQKLTPDESTPTASQELQGKATSPPPTASSAPTTATSTDSTATSTTAVKSPNGDGPSNNPFFKRMQSTDATTGAVASPPASTSATATNPFHRLSQSQQAGVASVPTTKATVNVRGGQDDDDWSVVDSNNDSSDDEPEPGNSSAKHLASILFGTMGGSTKRAESPAVTSPRSPPPVTPSVPGAFAPPPAPPLPQMNDAVVPSAPPPPPPPPGGFPTGAPPPPPPAPGGAAPPPPPPPTAMPKLGGGGAPDIGGLLGQIQGGMRLKKAQTNDRSTSTSAGRVL